MKNFCSISVPVNSVRAPAHTPAPAPPRLTWWPSPPSTSICCWRVWKTMRSLGRPARSSGWSGSWGSSGHLLFLLLLFHHVPPFPLFVCRIFKLVRHFAGLQSLFYTLKQAYQARAGGARVGKIGAAKTPSVGARPAASAGGSGHPDLLQSGLLRRERSGQGRAWL